MGYRHTDMPSNIRYYMLSFQANIALNLLTKHTQVLPSLFALDQGPYVMSEEQQPENYLAN
jgi:hypothetical protein